MTRKNIINAKAIGYISALGGIEIKNIEYGINDRIYCVSNAWYGKPTAHKVRIYDGNEPYIILYGQRFNLNEAIRCN